MTDDMDPRAQRLRDMVVIVLDAVSRAPGDRANDAVDAQAIVNAFHYITAAML